MTLWQSLRNLFSAPSPHPAPVEDPDSPLDPVHPRVLVIEHNPFIPSANRRLHELLGWNSAQHLAQQYQDDVRAASHGFARYTVVDRIQTDDFPLKADGFRYTPDAYLAAWRARQGFHQPDLIDYAALLTRHAIVDRLNADAIDEVWLFGFPYAGYYESVMGGPAAFWCNAPPLDPRRSPAADARRRFIIMGFNCERGAGEMLENLGHRVESIMAEVYRGRHGAENHWERFIRHEKTHPGQAGCGNVHFAPNSVRDYDWGNQQPVESEADDWLHFPDLQGRRRVMDCAEWGHGDTRAHHLWWLRHLPHVAGATAGIAHNWWRYIIDPNHVRLSF